VQATVAATAADSNGFLELGLSAAVRQALTDVGYEAPTPIQAATIPTMLAGSDVLGQAQTGTGKTGAFALPILSQIDLSKPQTQALVLVPTRELAIQVAEAFQRYATHMKGFHVLPIYGGQSYVPQLKGLKRGAHVIVGTPGRVMDHMNRGTLPLDTLRFLVLDEADEMLQMGFIDAIEWILTQSPPTRQIALFSATMPSAIRRIAQKHQRSPAEITIRSKTSTAPNIRQRYWLVSGMHKLDALTRILEVETFDAMLVFVRTKLETVELSERLEARGFDAAPLNGDIPQQQRERTIAALKAGKVDIVVATDVAARGLDVERISHVVNYDVPYDSESYIHRIGRTGRAGRSGEAILFIAPRERNMLRTIERATRQQIAQMNLPSIADVNEQRVAKFKQRIVDTLAAGETQAFRSIIEQFEAENEVPTIEIAAALASLLQGSTPLLLPERGDRDGGGDEWGRRRDERGGARGEDRGEGGGWKARGDDRGSAGASAGGGRDARRSKFSDAGGARRNDRDASSVQGFQNDRSGNNAQGTYGGNTARGSQGADRGATSAQSPQGGNPNANGAQGPRRGTDRGATSAQGSQSGNANGAQGPRDTDHGANSAQDSHGTDHGVTLAEDSQGTDRGASRAEGSQHTDPSDTGTVEVFERVADKRHDVEAQRDAETDRSEGERPSGDGGNEQRPGNGTERLPDRAAAETHPAGTRPPREHSSREGRRRRNDGEDVVFETFRLEVGHAHGVKPGNIVGAIANEAGLEGRHIGHVDIRDDHSFVDLPEGMPKDIFRNLKKVRVVGQELRISRVDGKPARQH
jgi:ATP-dependent RNA helicase DeaD